MPTAHVPRPPTSPSSGRRTAGTSAEMSMSASFSYAVQMTNNQTRRRVYNSHCDRTIRKHAPERTRNRSRPQNESPWLLENIVLDSGFAIVIRVGMSRYAMTCMRLDPLATGRKHLLHFVNKPYDLQSDASYNPQIVRAWTWIDRSRSSLAE